MRAGTTPFPVSAATACHISVCGLTIYGIQPERLKDFPDLAKDGLLQRINMIRASAATASRGDVAVRGADIFQTAITSLTRREAQRYRTTSEGSAIIRQTEQQGRCCCIALLLYRLPRHLQQAARHARTLCPPAPDPPTPPSRTSPPPQSSGQAP